MILNETIHDITVILLKIAFNTIKLNPKTLFCICKTFGNEKPGRVFSCKTREITQEKSQQGNNGKIVDLFSLLTDSN